MPALPSPAFPRASGRFPLVPSLRRLSPRLRWPAAGGAAAASAHAHATPSETRPASPALSRTLRGEALFLQGTSRKRRKSNVRNERLKLFLRPLLHIACSCSFCVGCQFGGRLLVGLKW